VADKRDYRTEAAALKNAENAQIQALLIAFDLIDNAVKAGLSILEPLRHTAREEKHHA
jgi:hypothetical protein